MENLGYDCKMYKAIRVVLIIWLEEQNLFLDGSEIDGSEIRNALLVLPKRKEKNIHPTNKRTSQKSQPVTTERE